MKRQNRLFCSALSLSIAAALTGCGNVRENISEIKDPGTDTSVSNVTVNNNISENNVPIEEKDESVPETIQDNCSEEEPDYIIEDVPERKDNLVYQEYLTLLAPDQEQKIEDAGCSDISAYPYGTEPLLPAEVLHELMKNYER